MGLVIVLLAGCSKKSGKLQMAVEKGNASCPISMGPVGQCESMTYEDDMVVYTLAVN